MGVSVIPEEFEVVLVCMYLTVPVPLHIILGSLVLLTSCHPLLMLLLVGFDGTPHTDDSSHLFWRARKKPLTLEERCLKIRK